MNVIDTSLAVSKFVTSKTKTQSNLGHHDREGSSIAFLIV